MAAGVVAGDAYFSGFSSTVAFPNTSSKILTPSLLVVSDDSDYFFSSETSFLAGDESSSELAFVAFCSSDFISESTDFCRSVVFSLFSSELPGP